MKELIVVIATKNRSELLNEALRSVCLQTKKPDEVVVVSDSIEETKKVDRESSIRCGFTFLEDKYTHNYAGNLNTAIDYIVKTRLIGSKKGIDDVYLAFLDDDDKWDKDYLEKCAKATRNGADFVVSGLYYKTDEKEFPISIPQSLEKDSFLAINPHIQGSNTFVRLTTLLEAGCFDESLSSTTDRDIFTRVLMLNPTYSIVNEHLVFVDAQNSRPRLTNSSEGKRRSLAQFYAKYGGLMDDETKAGFFERTKRYAPITESEIGSILPTGKPEYAKEYKLYKPFDNRIVFSFVTTSEEMALRLIGEINDLDVAHKKIICFANYRSDDEYEKLSGCLSSSKIPFDLKTTNDIFEFAKDERIRGFISKSSFESGIVSDIAVARTLIHQFAKQGSMDGDIVWILDDDMEFFEYRFIGGKLEKQPIDINEVIGRYKGKYDVVVGSYSNDAPLPSLSVIRCSLLDYTYKKCLSKNQYFDDSIYSKSDYYYDLTESGNTHLECPAKINGSISIDDVFAGKATSRPLFSTGLHEFEPNSRGGNTVIFNRDVLDIPNISINLGNTLARRGDFFWALQAKKLGFKIIGSSFSTFHNRIANKYDYEKEIDKEIKDLIGSSFTKAYSNMTGKTREEFYSLYLDSYQGRLTRLIESYSRVIGLLKINNDEFYSSFFNKAGLENLIRIAMKYTERSMVESSFDYLSSISINYERSLEKDKYISIIEKAFSTKIIKVLGIGNEGIVMTDGQVTYKLFYSKIDASVYEEQGSAFQECDELFSVTFKDLGENSVICYKTNLNYEEYSGGYAFQVADLISFLKTHGLVLTNIKRTNFLLFDKELKYIDYGKNIEVFDEEKYQRSIERAYQMLRYPELSMAEYKEMISKSYLGQSKEIDFGIEAFEKLLKRRYKEQVHDPVIYKIIEDTKPKDFLDYGAGKCKIANRICKAIDSYVYDVDLETIENRADKSVHIVKDIEKLDRQFDFVNCNKVLCCTDEKWNRYIVSRISGLVRDSGIAVFSICDPFFDDVQKTETRRSGYDSDYSDNSVYYKKDIYGQRKEYHRPFAYYERLLSECGFEIIRTCEDSGINIDTLNFIGEHLFFICKKKVKPLLEDCSLLIKANYMEHSSIYENVVHIVNQLEKNSSFVERIVVVDEGKQNRNRCYDIDDKDAFDCAISKLKEQGYIDRIIYSSSTEKERIYHKYFKATATDSYSSNGQQILATLVGFDSIKTRYLFQTDSDIIYSNKSNDGMALALQKMKDRNDLTLSLSIATKNDGEITTGGRVEVRSCFLDLKKLDSVIPLDNPVVNGTYDLPWHRALDSSLKEADSIRLVSNKLFFIHPENETKKIPNFLSKVRYFIENGLQIPSKQYGKVNLTGTENEWSEKLNSDMIIFVRGRNTSPEKLRRLFDSFKRQNYQDFDIAYFDDASDDLSKEYAKCLFKHDPYFKGKAHAVFNETRVGSLANFEFFYKEMSVNPETIIVNIDNDDCLLSDEAISTIKSRFDEGAEVTVGGCFRADKPLRRYEVVGFKKSWERSGDNIWLHPKCFRRYMCNWIQGDLKLDGKYVDIATDYAMMLPIVEHATNPIAIHDLIYYFDPSPDNSNKANKYGNNNSYNMRKKLLKRAEEKSMKKTIAVIGDSNIPKDSKEYQLAYKLGKALIDNGYKVQTGGLGGVMEASMKGAKDSSKYSKGDTIAIIPSNNEKEVNDYADVVIPTGLDILRNGKVVDADAVISIGGGAGTLSEIAMAWQLFKLIVSFTNFGGWSEKLAGMPIDERERYLGNKNDVVMGVSTIEEAIKAVNENIDKYNRKHTKIVWRKK